MTKRYKKLNAWQCFNISYVFEIFKKRSVFYALRQQIFSLPNNNSLIEKQVMKKKKLLPRRRHQGKNVFDAFAF